ncbi:hypothetical protein ACVW0Y_000867 [Pseudomonas sp. TE3786]
MLALTGCERPPAIALDQQVYIWQRQWRPAHAQALADSRADFSTLRVLAAQAHPEEGWIQARIDSELLRQDGRPLIAVIRLDGQLPRLDNSAIRQHLQSIVRIWQASGLNLRGVEIDHDCASARLPAYAALLQEIRSELPAELSLSITALPAWLSSPALKTLLAKVDGSVLQVHAVNRPEAGLFDARQAERWARAYARLSGKPFLLALPAYGAALTADGAVESEVPLRQGGGRQELQAEPAQVAELLRTLDNSPVPQLAGLIWFRLPLAGDRRAWPLVTLQAVMHRQALHSDVQVTVQQQADANAELYELRLTNPGNLPAALPPHLSNASASCQAGDGAQGYRLQRAANSLEFVRQQPGQLAAGHSRALGWLRCSQLDQGGFRVTP